MTASRLESCQGRTWKRTRSPPSSSSMSNACKAELRAPVSSLAFTHRTSMAGRETHSRHPTTVLEWMVSPIPPSFQEPTVKLAILSRAPQSYSTQRLKAAALDRGHRAKVLDTLRFSIDLSGEEPDLQYRGKLLSDYDAILPRIGSSITYFGTAVVRQFEQMDVYTPNTANGITNSRDKLRANQILSRHNIGMPATAFVHSRADVRTAIESVGGAPVVIKLLEGTQGIGVILAPEAKIAEAIIETLHSTKQNVLVQAFIAESRGRDIRALVVGDRVVAAMRRVASGDEFRSNVHRGGTVEKVTLTPEFEEAAVRSAQIMGLRVAGVDMLEGKDGPLVMEVN